jgi:hypothetical protein
MDGLVVLGAIGLYVVVLVGCSVAGYKIAAWLGWARSKRWVAATVGFCLIFLPVFWDTMPTLWMHQYYCETEGGLVIRKSLAEWESENPNIAQTLEPASITQNQRALSENKYAIKLNQRFQLLIEEDRRPFSIKRRRERVVDIDTNEVLAEYANFSTDISRWPSSGLRSFRDVKIWMARDFCVIDPIESGRMTFEEFWRAVMVVGVEK